MAIPVASLSTACYFGHSLLGTSDSNSSERDRCLSVVNVVCCVGSGLCDGSITRQEESYRMCLCVFVCVCV